MSEITLDGLTKPREDLLNSLFKIAPLSTDSTTVLKNDGWDSFFSFRPFEPNGSVNSYDVQKALEKISKEVPLSTGDWKLICARDDTVPQEERIHELLKKKTEQRIEWEKNQTNTQV